MFLKRMKKIKINKNLHLYLILTLFLGLISVVYYFYNQLNILKTTISQREMEISLLLDKLNILTKDLVNKTKQISNLQEAVQQKEQQIESQRIQIESLTLQVQSLQSQLGQTKEELEETQRLLRIAKKYEERVERGIYLSKAYKLLADYDKTIEIIKNITTIGTPRSDEEIWQRAKDIYNWLGENYQYCSDKGFCISEDYCTQIQFFSPDELLYYGSQDVLCGDCDDQAHLFAGMMYASGVSYNKVRVECGWVDSGYHCWNGVYVNGSWYRIDPVCSNPAKYIEFFGIKILLSGREFPTIHGNVDCFSSYELTAWYTPEGYHTIS